MTKKLYFGFFLILFSVCTTSCKKQLSPKDTDNFSKQDSVAIVRLDKKDSKNTISSAVDIPIYDKTTDPKTANYELLETSSIKNLKEYSCAEEKTRYISLPNKDDIRLVLVPQDCGDFDYRYYLLTIKNNAVVSDLYVEGTWQEPEGDSSKENTSFKIDKDFKIFVKTEISNSTKSISYKIDEDGKIVEL